MSGAIFVSDKEQVEPEVIVEQKRLSVNECFVYKVPPMKTASGHRAEDWGLADPLFTGVMRVFQADTKMRIVLYAYKDSTTLLETDENLVQFGECPIEVQPAEDITKYVDAVIDSSRYFVLRMKDPKSGRSVNIGCGFRDREVAFDFKNSLNEYVRYIDRQAAAEQMQASRDLGETGESSDDADKDENVGTKLAIQSLGDMSLKDGQKIQIKGREPKKEKPKTVGAGLTLAPPPAAGSTVFSKVTLKRLPSTLESEASDALSASSSDKEIRNNEDDDDDFGDFEGGDF